MKIRVAWRYEQQQQRFNECKENGLLYNSLITFQKMVVASIATVKNKNFNTPRKSVVLGVFYTSLPALDRRATWLPWL